LGGRGGIKKREVLDITKELTQKKQECVCVTVVNAEMRRGTANPNKLLNINT